MAPPLELEPKGEEFEPEGEAPREALLELTVTHHVMLENAACHLEALTDACQPLALTDGQEESSLASSGAHDGAAGPSTSLNLSSLAAAGGPWDCPTKRKRKARIERARLRFAREEGAPMLPPDHSYGSYLSWKRKRQSEGEDDGYDCWLSADSRSATGSLTVSPQGRPQVASRSATGGPAPAPEPQPAPTLVPVPESAPELDEMIHEMLDEMLSPAFCLDQALLKLNATRDEQLAIRKAVFRGLQRSLHPDKHTDCPEAANRAFQLLMTLQDAYFTVWEEQWSEEYQLPYFWNAKMREAAWEIPLLELGL